MGKFYKSCIYRDGGGYAIGDLNDHNWVTGLGYVYWAKNNLFAMGKFNNQKRNGWSCGNFELDGDFSNIGFFKWKNDDITAGLTMTSFDKALVIGQASKDGKESGYRLIVYPDGSWRCQMVKPLTRTVFYDAKSQSLYFGEIKSKEVVWQKKVDGRDWSIPFGRFTHQIEPKQKYFMQDCNEMRPKKRGPYISRYDDDDTTYIGGLVKHKSCGVTYEDADNTVTIYEQLKGELNGPQLCVWKDDDYYFEYTFKIGKHKDPTKVIGFGTGEIEICKYTDDFVCDILNIDKNFNIAFFEHYNTEYKKYGKRTDVNFSKK